VFASSGERRYKKLFLIAAEGIKTESLYFGLFTDDTSIVRVHCLKGKHDSAPPQVLKRMTEHLEREGLKSSDEAWTVIDEAGLESLIARCATKAAKAAPTAK